MKKITYLIISVILLAGCTEENPISVEQKGYFIKFFGGSYFDDGYDVLQLSDDSYIFTGVTTDENDQSDLVLIKTDAFGNQIWQKTFGDSLNDLGRSICLSSDGSLIITGSYTNNNDNSDIFLIKTSQNGDIIWEKTIGGPANEEGFCILENSDGTLMVSGTTDQQNIGNGNPAGEKDIFLMKTSASGDSTWTVFLGGPSTDLVKDMALKSDNGLILIGSSNSFSEPGQAGMNLIVIETNQSGFLLDKLTYGGASVDNGEAVEILSDGYLFCGSTNNAGSSDVYLIRTGANIHDVIWSHSYGGNAPESGSSIIENNDGSYTIAGFTESEGEGGKDGLIIKTDNSGTELYRKTFGGAGNEYINNIYQTNDNGFIFVGATEYGENSMINLTKLNQDCELK